MSTACYNSHDLVRLLDHQLTIDVERQMTAHLSRCAACKELMEQLSAAPQFWREVAQQLQSSPASDPPTYEAPHDKLAAVRAVLAPTSPHTHIASPSNATLPGSQPDVDHEELLRQHDHEALRLYLQQWLGPTDDPHSLGRLGNYEITGVIGVGGMGVVLKGVDISLNRSVAIKALASHLTTSGAARQRFEREAQAAASVVHENVLAIHAIDQWHGVPYFVMPLVRGESLEKRLQRIGAFELVEILRIARQVALGLAAAHQQCLVHRDIKPANILMEQGSQRLAISDFGLARVANDASLTRSGHIVGTPLYMSPEQAKGEAVDHRSDIFSFGSMLYALCTGHPPFRAETPYGVIRRLCEETASSIQQYNTGIPDWLCGLIERMMSKSANERPNSAAELAELFTVGLAHTLQPGNSLPEKLAGFESRAHARASRTTNRQRTLLRIAVTAGAISIVCLATFGSIYLEAIWSPTVALIAEAGQSASPAEDAELPPTNPSADVVPASDPSLATEQSVVEPRPTKSVESNALLANSTPVDSALTSAWKYQFAIDQQLRYEVELQFDDVDQRLTAIGTVDFDTVALLEDAVELNYRIQLTPDVQNIAETKVNKQRPARYVDEPFPSFGPRFGTGISFPSIEPPSFPGSPFSESTPAPLADQMAQVNNCNCAGRVKVGLAGGVLGNSHRRDLPNQLGNIIDWIFLAVCHDASSDQQWTNSSTVTLEQIALLRSDSNLEIVRTQVARTVELAITERDETTGRQTAKLIVLDSLPDAPKANPIQQLTGQLAFDAAAGQIQRLEIRRSAAPDTATSSGSLTHNRPLAAQLKIHRVD